MEYVSLFMMAVFNKNKMSNRNKNIRRYADDE